MGFVIAAIKAAFDYFKVDPKKAANIVALAIGWLMIAVGVIEQAVLPIMYKAIEILRQLLQSITG